MSNAGSLIQQAQPQFLRIAEPQKLVRWEEESSFAIQALERNTKLSGCDPNTIRDAISNVAAVGLTLNPVHGYAYLVPEYHTQSKLDHCHLRISFKGLCKIATDSGVVAWVRADVVKRNDEFLYRGLVSDQLPEHKMDPFGDRGESVGVYCVAKLHTGEYMTEVAAWPEVMRAKDAAKTQNVWTAWPDEMAKKFIIKRAAKQWPHSVLRKRLDTAIDIANETEGSMTEIERLDGIAFGLEQAMERDDDVAIYETWDGLTDVEKRALWASKERGGWFDKSQKACISAAIKKLRVIEGETEEPEPPPAPNPESVVQTVIREQGLNDIVDHDVVLRAVVDLRALFESEQTESVSSMWWTFDSDTQTVIWSKLDSKCRSWLKKHMGQANAES